MESEEHENFKGFVEQLFRGLTSREFLPHEGESVALQVSDLFAAFEQVIVRHHEIQVRDDQKYKQLETQLDEISEAFEHLQKDVNRLSGDKLISIKIPDKPRHLHVQKEDSSDEDANSFRPEDDSTPEEVRQREKELRQQKRDQHSAKLESSRDSGEPEPEFRIPRDGLPELYEHKLEPQPLAPHSHQAHPADHRPHTHSAKCPCRQHDHSHLLFDPHDNPEGLRK
jgi:hypothetical protein